MKEKMNTEFARTNMIQQQLRTCDITNDDILDLLKDTPREDFVPELYQPLAFADMTIPLLHDQVMMTPYMETMLLQSVAVQPSDTVLEIGTGSGYLTAL